MGSGESNPRPWGPQARGHRATDILLWHSTCLPLHAVLCARPLHAHCSLPVPWQSVGRQMTGRGGGGGLTDSSHPLVIVVRAITLDDHSLMFFLSSGSIITVPCSYCPRQQRLVWTHNSSRCLTEKNCVRTQPTGKKVQNLVSLLPVPSGCHSPPHPCVSVCVRVCD